MKILIIPITIISIFIIAASAIVLNSSKNPFYKRNNTQNINKVTNNSIKDKTMDGPSGSVFITPTNQIKLNVEPSNLSAVSIRLIYPSTGPLPTITLNAELLENEWLFPVKQVYQEEGSVVVDLAAVNLLPEGYFVNGEMLLGKLELSENVEQSEFKFDDVQTKIIRKDAAEFNLSL